MKNQLLSPKYFEQSDVLEGKLGEMIQFCQLEQQTMLLDVDVPGDMGQVLLFTRGQLVTVYRIGTVVERQDPLIWLDLLKSHSPKVSLRMLALTPQDMRIFKILIEQRRDNRCVIVGAGQPLEQQFVAWMGQPVPALARVQWPKSEALVLLPGSGHPPLYTLFLTRNQIFQSAGGVTEILGHQEDYEEVSLYDSEPHTLAWTEYLLHQAFAGIVLYLLEKIEKLIGRMVVNQIIRDVNFKATAHDWNLNINANSINDQTIFSSPITAAEVYSRLLEVIFQNFEAALGGVMLDMLIQQALFRLSPAARMVINEYLPGVVLRK